MPEDSEFYLHRMGRTGRATQIGTTISFFDEKEEKLLLDAERYMNVAIKRLPLPKELIISDELLEEERERIHMPNVYVKIATKPAWHKENVNGKIRAKRKW
jgi:ATP-dependent RNA helicase RhlE